MLNQINLSEIIIGFCLLFFFYILSIYLNLLIVKKNENILPGTFKLYSFAVFVSVICNLLGVILVKYNISSSIINFDFIKIFDCINFFDLLKIAILVLALYIINSLKNSGDPRYVADYKDINSGELDPDMPFSSTLGMSFCIMVSYTFPFWLAMIVMFWILFVQGLFKLEKYKLRRVVVLIVMVGIETAIATHLVRLSYKLNLLLALLSVAFIGMIFNIVLGSLNEIVLDRVAGDYFSQD